MWQCLIIEDDLDNARYLSEGLEELGHLVRIATNGIQGFEMGMSQEWDIIILDRMLPQNIDGLSTLASLRSFGKKTPVLVLSALSAVDDRIDGLKAGGDDYLVKPFSFSELVARMDALIRRSRPNEETKKIRVSDLTLDVEFQRAHRSGTTIQLKPQEFRLLLYLAINAGKIVTRKMLLEKLWGYNFDPQSNIIDVQVSRLRRKIDFSSFKPLIHTVRGTGYILSETPPSEQSSNDFHN